MVAPTTPASTTFTAGPPMTLIVWLVAVGSRRKARRPFKRNSSASSPVEFTLAAMVALAEYMAYGAGVIGWRGVSGVKVPTPLVRTWISNQREPPLNALPPKVRD